MFCRFQFRPDVQTLTLTDFDPQIHHIRHTIDMNQGYNSSSYNTNLYNNINLTLKKKLQVIQWFVTRTSFRKNVLKL